jgi:hypothetical protein
LHTIYFVSDEAIPAGHDFIFVEIPAGALIFYRESAITPQVLEDSWAAYRALRKSPPVEPTYAPPWMGMLYVA